MSSISPNLPIRTAEGVELGWKAAKVKTVYSTIDLANVEHLGRAIPQVPGNSAAVYRIGFRDEAVSSLALQFSDQTCYE